MKTTRAVRAAVVLGAAVAAILFAAACGQTEPTSPATPPVEATLKTALSAYVVEFLRRNPTTNTYLGGAGLDPSLREVDGMLRDYSTTALTDEDSWLE